MNMETQGEGCSARRPLRFSRVNKSIANLLLPQPPNGLQPAPGDARRETVSCAARSRPAGGGALPPGTLPSGQGTPGRDDSGRPAGPRKRRRWPVRAAPALAACGTTPRRGRAPNSRASTAPVTAPPRGMASTSGSCNSRPFSFSARRWAASSRSRNINASRPRAGLLWLLLCQGQAHNELTSLPLPLTECFDGAPVRLH